MGSPPSVSSLRNYGRWPGLHCSFGKLNAEGAYRAPALFAVTARIVRH
jgi:hypothetical protein